MLFETDPDDQDTSGDAGFNYTQFSISQAMTSPPTENTLSTSTYWPELEKLYGHGYEVRRILLFSSLAPRLRSHAYALLSFPSFSALRPLFFPRLYPHRHLLQIYQRSSRRRSFVLYKDVETSTQHPWRSLVDGHEDCVQSG